MRLPGVDGEPPMRVDGCSVLITFAASYWRGVAPAGEDYGWRLVCFAPPCPGASGDEEANAMVVEAGRAADRAEAVDAVNGLGYAERVVCIVSRENPRQMPSQTAGSRMTVHRSSWADRDRIPPCTASCPSRVGPARIAGYWSCRTLKTHTFPPVTRRMNKHRSCAELAQTAALVPSHTFPVLCQDQ